MRRISPSSDVALVQADDVVSALTRRGFRFYAGVPCSHLTGLISRVIDGGAADYVAVANKAQAIAVAAGAALGGRSAVAMFQNSGFGNAVNPLTSLTYTLRIPVLDHFNASRRPRGSDRRAAARADGSRRNSHALFDLMEMPWEYFPIGRKNSASARSSRRQMTLHRACPTRSVLAEHV